MPVGPHTTHPGVFGQYWFAQTRIVLMTLPVRGHVHSHTCPGVDDKLYGRSVHGTLLSIWRLIQEKLWPLDLTVLIFSPLWALSAPAVF